MISPEVASVRLLRLDRRLAARARVLWSLLRIDDLQGSWVEEVLPPLVAATVAAQTSAAGIGADAADAPSGSSFSSSFLADLGVTARGFRDAGIRPDPGAFAGFAGDGRLLGQALSGGVTRTYVALDQGASQVEALASGAVELDQDLTTVVHDAARIATGVGVAAGPHWTGYVRNVEGGACSRCIVLSGRVYRWSQGFRRHPKCRCWMVPQSYSVAEPDSPEKIFAGMSPAEQDATFGKDSAQAIRDGASMSSVVNARLGITEAGTTLQGVTRRGWTNTVQREIARQEGRPAPRVSRVAPKPRLLPERIYQVAGNDRAAAMRLLIENGYIIGDPKELAAMYRRLEHAVDLSTAI